MWQFVSNDCGDCRMQVYTLSVQAFQWARTRSSTRPLPEETVFQDVMTVHHHTDHVLILQ